MNKDHSFAQDDVRPEAWAWEFYEIRAEVKALASYEDLNFRLTNSGGQHYLLKIAALGTTTENLIAQNQILNHLCQVSNDAQAFPVPIKGNNRQDMFPIEINQQTRWLRLLNFLEGHFLHEVAHSSALLQHFGEFLGNLNTDLSQLSIPALRQKRSPWDLQYALDCEPYISTIGDAHYRRLVRYFLQQYKNEVFPKYANLPQSVIHGDANDHNVLVQGERVSGLIDFGDAAYSHRIHELAIALPYVMMGKDDPTCVAAEVVKGYHRATALHPSELEVLYHLINARMAVSLTMSSFSIEKDPENTYLVIHQNPVKKLLDKMLSINPISFENHLKQACQLDLTPIIPVAEQLITRNLHISNALSLSYQNPLRIHKGAMQYLYEADGTTYLDGVNNICHVGHCNPQVVAAACQQMAKLNTNTRYLYAQLNDYAAHLCSKLPEPLSVVFFVNSGSEANDLALRMARTHTGNVDFIVLEGAYHGNSTATLNISPYKYQSPGGNGPSDFVHEVPMPDVYRGKYRSSHPNPGNAYAQEVQIKIDEILSIAGGPAGFISESLLSCGGQIVLPPGFLDAAYRNVRKVGGVCIADEVQVGFGRVGSHFWGFQTQEVIPDIVTMGKPMGNGHPLAAVVTTPEIARSFDTGMEYFNSFGGNPVSCAIGQEVLKIIEEEHLQEKAWDLGSEILQGLNELKSQFKCIGDVRGLGLFLGIELVKDLQDLTPDANLAASVVEQMRQRGILLSTDGPLHNIIKFKPPMVFTKANAQYLLENLHATFTKIAQI